MKRAYEVIPDWEVNVNPMSFAELKERFGDVLVYQLYDSKTEEPYAELITLA
jgi:hypothetical protein